MRTRRNLLVRIVLAVLGAALAALGAWGLLARFAAIRTASAPERPELIDARADTVLMALSLVALCAGCLSLVAGLLWPVIRRRIAEASRATLFRVAGIVAGLALSALAVFCFSGKPEYIILNYLSRDALINPETVAVINLTGTASAIFGPALLMICLLWPRAVERAAALARPELYYSASEIGTIITVVFGLALGIRSVGSYDKITLIAAVALVLVFIERRFPARIAYAYKFVFNRRVALVGFAVAGTLLFQLRFPFATWNRYLFSRDFPMFQYTALFDLDMIKSGALYGWEPSFSCGYPTFLNLRSILIPYLPFAWLPPALAFHVMLFVTYVSVPYLVYWLARQICDDADAAVVSGWAAVGVMTGFFWHILLWGMAPTFESMAFFLLALGFFIRALKGSRWGVLLSALFWAPVAYIHFGHFAHVGLALFVAALAYAVEGRTLRPAWTLFRTSALTALLAAPYLALFYQYRDRIILTNMFSYPDSSVFGMVRSFLITVSHFVPALVWDWRGYFAARSFADWGYFSLATTFFFAVAYLFASGDRGKRIAASVYAGAIVIAALSFVPKFELSFQRMLYMVPPLMALALGFWLAEARCRGHVVPFMLMLVLFTFYTRQFWMNEGLVPPIPTVAERSSFDPAVLDSMKTLPGNYILYEDTASLTPYADADSDFPRVDESLDVHSESFAHLATGRRLFAHPGYNPHPYYDLRGTYIATGTYLGKDLVDYAPSVFRDLFRKWGVEYLVLWSKPAKRYFGDDPEYEKVLDGRQYSIYRLRDADPRAVVTDKGTGDVAYPDGFTAVVTLEGVTPGSRVVLRANYFPEWSASADGRPVTLENADGQIAFAAPAADCAVTLSFPKNRGWFAVPVLALILGLALSKRGIL